MEEYIKTYRKAQLHLSLEIVKKLLNSYKVVLDPKIEKAVLLLHCFGFSTSMSCEGHIAPYKGVNTFRLFWPYIMINLGKKTVFHLKGGDLRMETVAADSWSILRRLKCLVSLFIDTRHPFNGSKRYPHELTVISRNNGITEPEHVLDVVHSIEKHWNLHALICDVGVQGIITMPQEMLNNAFRKRFLVRTQHEMEYFTNFLEWFAIEGGIETLELQGNL